MSTIEQQMPERWGLTRAPQPGPVGRVCVQSVVQDGEVAVRLYIVVPPASRKRARPETAHDAFVRKWPNVSGQGEPSPV